MTCGIVQPAGKNKLRSSESVWPSQPNGVSSQLPAPIPGITTTEYVVSGSPPPPQLGWEGLFSHFLLCKRGAGQAERNYS